jgi:HK97 family phage portal protein
MGDGMFVSRGSLVTKSPTLDASYFPRYTYMPPMSSSTYPTAYGALYRQQLWVYVLVSKRSRATARLPLPVYERDELNRPRRDEHPMSKLLQSPNPALSPFALWRWTSATFDIYGEAVWWKKRRNGQVVELWPLHPTGLTLNADGTSDFTNGRLSMKDIPPSDLVTFRDYDPETFSHGMSPLEPLRATLENEWAARTATSSFWQRGARPGTALKHPKNISEGAQRRLKVQYDDLAAGASNTGATVVLEEGMEPVKLDLTAEEAQYIETRKLNREEVCAAYDVPPPVVHILDRATFSNITEQMRSMYRDTMAPHLRNFESAVELDLRAAEWPNDNVYAEFLMDEVLRGDFETRQTALATATHMTIAEKRKVENLPHLDGTDRLFLPAGVLPLSAIDANAAAQAASGTEQPKQVDRALMGRLARQVDLAELDAADLAATAADPASFMRAYVAEAAAGGTVEGLRNRLKES